MEKIVSGFVYIARLKQIFLLTEQMVVNLVIIVAQQKEKLNDYSSIQSINEFNLCTTDHRNEFTQDQALANPTRSVY